MTPNETVDNAAIPCGIMGARKIEEIGGGGR
jgi:hypothetical protein